MTGISADEYFENAMYHNNRGDLPTAVRLMERAILAGQDTMRTTSLAACYNNRGNMLKLLGNGFDAVLNYNLAVELEPGAAEYVQNRGAAWVDCLGELVRAEADYRRAIEIKPAAVHALTNLGNLLKITDRREEAVELYRRAIAADPDYVDAHLNLSFALLDLGQFEEGWRKYEWRWRSGQLPPRALPVPNWEGEDLRPDEAVLVYGEQGHGDAIQFMRYAPLIKSRCGGRVYVEVRQPLARLARTMRGIDGVVVYGERVPDDVRCGVAMMSAPRILKTTVDTIPCDVPYVGFDQSLAERWRQRLALLPPGPRVGLCWAGMSRPSQPAAAMVDSRRSMRLADMEPLTRDSGVSWVSLQVGARSAEARQPPPQTVIGDWSEEVDDFADTAALISCLDAVVTVDTAVAHVAGALGKPTVVVARHDSCWRWMSPREDSPWYPTLRHYRQASPGDWSAPLAKAREDITKLVDARQITSAAA